LKRDEKPGREIYSATRKKIAIKGVRPVKCHGVGGKRRRILLGGGGFELRKRISV